MKSEFNLPFESLAVTAGPIGTTSLIDLNTQPYGQVRDLLCARSMGPLTKEADRFLFKTYRTTGRFTDEADVQEYLDTSRANARRAVEWQARQAIHMADLKNVPVEQLFAEQGLDWEEFGLQRAFPADMADFYEKDWSLRKEKIHEKIASLVAQNKIYAFHFLHRSLERVLHSKAGVGMMLTVVEALMKELDLGWEQVLEQRLKLMTPFEKGAHAFLAEGPRPLDEFFRYTMFNDEDGVYTRANSLFIGNHSDAYFSTHAHLPMFQLGLTLELFERWKSLGMPDLFEVVEMGAGLGSLAEGILKFSDQLAAHNQTDTNWGSFAKALNYRIIEISPALAAQQRERLKPWNVQVQVASAIDGDWDRVDQGVYLSNELMDMFPPKKIKKVDGELWESYLMLQGGVIQELLGPLSQRGALYIEEHGIQIEEGAVYFAIPDVPIWLQNLDSKLGRGYVISVDYGGSKDLLDHKSTEHYVPMFRGYAGECREEFVWEEFQHLVPDGLKPLVEQVNALYRNSLTAGLDRDMTVDVDLDVLNRFVEARPMWRVNALSSERLFVLDVLGAHGAEYRAALGHWTDDEMNAAINRLHGPGMWVSILEKQ